MLTTVTIDGTPYTATERSAAGIRPDELTRVLEGGYDTFAFHEMTLSPFPAFHGAQPVEVAIDYEGGGGPKLYFRGMIVDVQSRGGRFGWTHGYNCNGLKFLADRVPITAPDGTGAIVYNRAQTDEYRLLTDTGLDVGTIIARVLNVPATAAALDAVGVGAYVTLTPPTLPAATIADLALLTIVPPEPVTLSGEGIIDQLQQLVAQWMPKFFLEITPSGTVRARDITDAAVFVPRTITLGVDVATWPSVRRSVQDCATRLVTRGGPQVEAAMLSEVDGTLAQVFDGTDISTWTFEDFTNPKDSVDVGSVTATTSTSATLTSDDPGVSWATNFWALNNGTVTLVDTLATGIDVTEQRTVISCDALSPGGSADVNWDGSWPVSNTTYDRYRIVGAAGGLIDTWRTYAPREPSSGDTALDTWVGAHLVAYSPYVIAWSNATKTLGEHFPTGMVVGPGGASIPWPLEPVPSEGIFRFYRPTVSAFGSEAKLNLGSPATVADGLPEDVQILALYSRGAMSVTVPPDVGGVPQYEGTAYTEDGLKLTRYLDYAAWNWQADAASMTELAQQHLDSMKDAEIDISIDWIVAGGVVPAWDFLAFEYAINVDIDGATSPWTDLNAAARSVQLRWVTVAEGMTHVISINASTRKRPFSGDAMFVHPQFREGSPLSNAQGFGQVGVATSAIGMMTNGGVSAAMTTGVGEGNVQSYNQALAEGRVSGGGTSVPGSPLAGRGASFGDIMAAGADRGGGVRDEASRADQRHHERFEKGQRFIREDAELSRETPRLERQQRQSQQRQDQAFEKQQRTAERKEAEHMQFKEEQAKIDAAKHEAEISMPTSGPAANATTADLFNRWHDEDMLDRFQNEAGGE